MAGRQLMASQATIDGLGPMLTLFLWPLLDEEGLGTVVHCTLVSNNGRHHCGEGS
jgi:hypothetical protein